MAKSWHVFLLALSSLLYLSIWKVFGCDFHPQCTCSGDDREPRYDCSNRSLSQIPLGIGGLAVELDLSQNRFTELPTDAFEFFHYLQKINLAGNQLKELPSQVFSRIINLKELILQDNHLTEVPRDALAHVSDTLEELHLGDNKIINIAHDAFAAMNKVQQLWLDNNQLTKIPLDSLKDLFSLRAMTLAHNSITEIPDYAFRNNTNLEILNLKNNQVSQIGSNAFNGLKKLKILDLNYNHISEFPCQAFSTLTDLDELIIGNNRLTDIPDKAFKGNSNLTLVQLQGNQIHSVGHKAFINLPKLEKMYISYQLSLIILIEYIGGRYRIFGNLFPGFAIGGSLLALMAYLAKDWNTLTIVVSIAGTPYLLSWCAISEAKYLKAIPDLTGTHKVEILILDRGNITEIPKDLCNNLRKLKKLDMHSNMIIDIPDLSNCTQLTILNLANNQIQSLRNFQFHGLGNLKDLILSRNRISYIPKDAFQGLATLQYLELHGNIITKIHMKAFIPVSNLQIINLALNSFPELPAEGLQNLRSLYTYKNVKLHEIPPKSAFPRIQKLGLSYPYHCCEYLNTKSKAEEEEHSDHGIEETIQFLYGYDEELTHNISLNLIPVFNSSEWEGYDADAIYEDLYEYLPGEFPHDDANVKKWTENYAEQYDDYDPATSIHITGIKSAEIECMPEPGPFFPCDELFGWWSLRCGVWFVFCLAIIGNGTVLFVLLTSRTKMDVPRFLICNLATADFLMGIYLGFLAIVDATTLGDFRKHAVEWQTGAGCLIAGFLAIVSSQLSVFTLTVITLERLYAIINAMHLDRRLSLRTAGGIMVGGWLYAVTTASLPMPPCGINDYRTVAVCLPFDVKDKKSLAYVCFIMFVNSTAFIIILTCYMKIYCSIRGSPAWNSNDSRVAKRMALLIFTDFACWAPISILSIASAFGTNLISLNEAKVFTIFVLPLNSCANPFLYAIFTKQFKKDCLNLCRRLEEFAISHKTNMNIGLTSFRQNCNIYKRHSRSQSSGTVMGLNAADTQTTLLMASRRQSIRNKHHDSQSQNGILKSLAGMRKKSMQSCQVASLPNLYMPQNQEDLNTTTQLGVLQHDLRKVNILISSPKIPDQKCEYCAMESLTKSCQISNQTSPHVNTQCAETLLQKTSDRLSTICSSNSQLSQFDSSTMIEKNCNNSDRTKTSPKKLSENTLKPPEFPEFFELETFSGDQKCTTYLITTPEHDIPIDKENYMLMTAEQDNEPGTSEMNATFKSQIGQDTCMALGDNVVSRSQNCETVNCQKETYSSDDSLSNECENYLMYYPAEETSEDLIQDTYMLSTPIECHCARNKERLKHDITGELLEPENFCQKRKINMFTQLPSDHYRKRAMSYGSENLKSSRQNHKKESCMKQSFSIYGKSSPNVSRMTLPSKKVSDLIQNNCVSTAKSCSTHENEPRKMISRKCSRSSDCSHTEQDSGCIGI